MSSENNIYQNIIDVINPESNNISKIFLFGSVLSIFDVAFELADKKKLQIWDSAIAKSQSCGRGQMRRSWFSPAGNIYAAIRIPVSGNFKDTRATPFMGLLCALALRKTGWPVLLKWPNDLILVTSEGPRKIGGILLEEREDILLAGIGINLASFPDETKLRENAALASSCLYKYPNGPISRPAPVELWQQLVMLIVSIYKSFSVSDDTWRNCFNSILLWKNDRIVLKDGEDAIYGQLQGISISGALLISTSSGTREYFSGNLGPA